jgi:hypothetical protein
MKTTTLFKMIQKVKTQRKKSINKMLDKQGFKAKPFISYGG